MGNNRQYPYEDDPTGEIISWVIVFVCIIAVWPLGLYLLWRKSKKSEHRREQRDRHKAEPTFNNNASYTHTHSREKHENRENRQRDESGSKYGDDPISEVARDIEDVVREVTTEAASVVKTIREELGDVFFDKQERMVDEIAAISVRIISLCLLFISVFFFVFAIRMMIGATLGFGGVFGAIFFLFGAVATLLAGFSLSSKASRIRRAPKPIKKHKKPEKKKEEVLQPEPAQTQAEPVAGEQGVQFMAIMANLRELKLSIADVQISSKADKIEELTAKIFRVVEEKPEKRPRIDRFLNYYLPTTTRLLQAYGAYEKQGVRGENITKAKDKIARTLDTLILGFELQLDQLFESDVMDIAAEVKVLETLMKQDGLSGKKRDFSV